MKRALDWLRAHVRPWKDPWSATTHFVGAWLAVAGAVWLVARAWDHPRLGFVMLVYGVSLVLLFAASSAYHFFDIGPVGNRWLRRIDHAAIFLVIAGTSAPAVALLPEDGLRAPLLWAIAAVAVVGIAFKVLWIDCPSWLGASIYILMGAIPLLAAGELFSAMPVGAAPFLLAGGAAYLVGAVVFVVEWPDPWPRTFGFHEVWHLFVLAGAASHYAFMHSLLAA